MKTPAPVGQLPPPEVQVISDNDDGNTRTVQLRIVSPRRAARMTIESQSDADVRAMTVNGKKLGEKEAHWRMDYRILPRTGIDLSLEIDSGKEIRFTAIDYSYSLFDIPGIEIRPRPPHLIPQPNTTNWDRDFQTDMVMVRKSFTL